MTESWHVVAIGSGFATSFFLQEYLRDAPANARVLVLERGPLIPQAERIARRVFAAPPPEAVLRRVGDMQKDWVFSMGFGGSSNGWWGCTPRMMPSDFQMHSLFGVGRDWPISFDELEPYYCEAEAAMQISGPSDGAPWPMSRPYPQPPHRFSEPDRLLKAKYPTLFFQQPTARARVATETRSACCANSMCHLCPANAKFTIENGFGDLYRDPRITLLTEAEALAIDIAASVARGVAYRHQGREQLARGDLVVLAANGIFNPYLMLRSGMEGPKLGRGLVEQIFCRVDVDLAGVENFSGSSAVNGEGWMFHDGPHRRERAACLVEAWNAPDFRLQPGRWKERLTLKFLVEDLPQDQNRVEVDPTRPERPLATYLGRSGYADRTLAAAGAMAAEMVAGLPVERIHPASGPSTSVGHQLCTTVMGDDPAESEVDSGLLSHRVRNLMVLGGSTFPTASPANPTLTVAALTIRAARRLRNGGAT